MSYQDAQMVKQKYEEQIPQNILKHSLRERME